MDSEHTKLEIVNEAAKVTNTVNVGLDPEVFGTISDPLDLRNDLTSVQISNDGEYDIFNRSSSSIQPADEGELEQLSQPHVAPDEELEKLSSSIPEGSDDEKSADDENAALDDGVTNYDEIHIDDDDLMCTFYSNHRTRNRTMMTATAITPDLNTYQQKKNLAQGMMDLALLSANANQLRYVLESATTHPYYYSSLTLITLSILFQIAVGVGLIMNSRYDVNDKKEICKADKINNMTVLGIFMITIVNVFITSFSVATPTAITPSPGVGIVQPAA